ncbi:MAG: hypothetical protein KA297_29400 [Kofleriaceae bacterium]|jgi:hypothetical protein|nr:hypothetical protein [Kofleriaceae bacterium]MBP6837286.1 hypothetical protein [Kofleriaceae bacterium]
MVAAAAPATAPPRRARAAWLRTWWRVVGGAGQRAAAPAWLGVGLFAAIAMGGNGLTATAATALMLQAPVVGAFVLGLWTLLIAPAGWALRRAPGRSYLRALPAPALAEPVGLVLLVVAMQAPWLLLWWLGAGPAWAAAATAPPALVTGLAAAWPDGRRQPGPPRWRGEAAALAGVARRSLTRLRAASVVRAPALAALGGLGVGALVGKNALTGPDAAIVAAVGLSPALVAAWVGPGTALAEGERRLEPWARALGLTPGPRLRALAGAAGLVALVLSAAAGLGLALGIGATAPTLPTAALAPAALAGVAVAGIVALWGVADAVRLGRAEVPIAGSLAAGAVVLVAILVLAVGLLELTGLGVVAAGAAGRAVRVLPARRPR